MLHKEYSKEEPLYNNNFIKLKKANRTIYIKIR
jgi:hypothetical protein